MWITVQTRLDKGEKADPLSFFSGGKFVDRWKVGMLFHGAVENSV